MVQDQPVEIQDDDLMQCANWARQYPETFGFLLRATIRAEKKAGRIAKQQVVLDALDISRETLTTWFRGEHLPQDFRALYREIPPLFREINSLRHVGPDDPIQNAACTALWMSKQTELNRTLKDKAWVWVLPWAGGIDVSQVSLTHAPARYENLMPQSAKDALRRWEKAFPTAYDKLNKEPSGNQVRLDFVTPVSAHGDHDLYEISISNARFIHYRAIHSRLGGRQRQLLQLRHECFANALEGLSRPADLLLPSVFSIHMAVVSSDKKALLRQRVHETAMYPAAWECSVGEMMHGPNYQGDERYCHFTKEKKPSLPLFLTAALDEELAYGTRKVDMSRFRLYGFAAEYLTLAPKLIVVFRSDLTGEVLLKRAMSRKVQDKCHDAEIIDLTPSGLANAFRRHKKWGPTSKLALMLALLETEPSRTGQERINKRVQGLVGH